eukprot:CAMPEP_0174825858 /NCGR_PEP_ID=MMETSP1107-20130205/43186_1 /TAXON_ID=36770 /ORGANISM="Paraphysomonas vestita, Strain GFlagA" /LENGTH=217 /DNA_ID=CAMNT_0016057905 /DNA_START=539 /DNA_END=1192 /DNA_ORIENTATION=-
MQDALSRMTLENKNQTDRLTEELKTAQAEVRALKNRLGQMEMFFLQHATGVASTKLTPTALRSLSGGGSKSNIKELLLAHQDENDDQIDHENIENIHSKQDSNDSKTNSQDETLVEFDPQIFLENQPEMYVPASNDPQQYNPEEVFEILKMSKLSTESQSSLTSNNNFSNNSTTTTTSLTTQNNVGGLNPNSAPYNPKDKKLIGDSNSNNNNNNNSK